MKYGSAPTGSVWVLVAGFLVIPSLYLRQVACPRGPCRLPQSIPPVSLRTTMNKRNGRHIFSSFNTVHIQAESPGRAALVAAPADHSPFNDDMNFKEWLKTAKFNRRLYPQQQGILSILPTLSQDLCSAAIDAGITHDTDIDQCCDTLAQLVIGQRGQTLVRDFFLRLPKS
ncbi:RNA directed DNA polymerase [Echinococcus multilocularis]|uniref:RNA directed DNA polymerase n=1 Tax=Echinococcus multilocularis TaxID=6211 RepID=A0A0S4MMK6_ECHMU|nr:RNA directed DNA polymerase [Echinococcus multilocularis]